MLDEATRERIVSRANLAPSVHNTQPARWRFEADGTITVLADESRFLKVGDPHGRDAGVSCGAAVEGTIIALAELGVSAIHVEDLWQSASAKGLRPAASIVPRDGGEPSSLSWAVDARFTWRAGFEAAGDSAKKGLAAWAAARDDVALATERADLEMLAGLNDEASLRFYRNDDYRAELVGWMRLIRSHPDYDRDGLNLEALGLSTFEGHAARLALGAGPLFRILDATRIAGLMLGERGKTLSSTAVVLFHRPHDEPAIATGREFYRMWLELAHLGYAAWPMAALADDPETAAACAAHFRIGDERRLINLLRVGIAPRKPPRARDGGRELILPAG
ncbi:hypothetical protein [Mesorhizobium sp. CAU 1732]|uniref:hypothetical protein n=1 Tax=Mesorhizobium sp. CAU 1732 TaxID=3140358 RepID=UPI0032617C6A